MSPLRKVVIIDGCRTPFLKRGDAFASVMSYQLLRQSLLSLLRRVGLPKESVQYLIAGNHVQEVNTYNIAREAALAAGLDPRKTPCHTVTQACISGNQAITNASTLICKGEFDVVVAGGTETLSDLHVRYPRPMRKLLTKIFFSKSNSERFTTALRMLRPGYIFSPEIAPIHEFTTGWSAGQHCEALNEKFTVSRKEQDEFALRSRRLAAKASDAGYHSDISPVLIDAIGMITSDNHRSDVTLDELSKLKPGYKKRGTVTTGNESAPSDGASCVLLMSETRAKALELRPKAVIKDFAYTSVDPNGANLLLGPAHAIARLLQKNKLTLSDIDLFEIHEAFAGQILANLKVLDSDTYSKDLLGLNKKLGMIPLDKLNTWGGSLSFGNPLGATGLRLVNMASNRLQKSNARLGLIASGASGGLGHAMLIERYVGPN